MFDPNCLEELPDAMQVSVNAKELRDLGVCDNEFITVAEVPDYRPVTITVGMLKSYCKKAKPKETEVKDKPKGA